MTKSISFIAFILFFLTSNVYAAAPQVVESVSAGGIKFWEIEDNYLPIISLHIVFNKSGTAYDPEDKLGLANMTSDLLVEGAGGMSGVDFMKRLEGLASKVSFSVDEDNFYVSVTCLKENIEESLRLVGLAIKSPNFSEDSLQRIRKAVLTNIARQEESPEAKASKVFRENYFKGHPYSRQIEGSVAGVNSINREDLVSFTKKHFVKRNMLIGVVGSVDKKGIGLLLDKYLAFLPKDTDNINDIPEFVPSADLGRIIKIEQDVPQSVVIFGFAAPKRKDKDFYDMYVANHIFGGGGFESRLMNEVREKRGLAYTVYTYAQTYEKAGLISGYLATKNKTVEEALHIAKDEIIKIHKSGVTERELIDAKDYLVGSFPLRMTRNSNLAAFITSMQYQELGMDFLERRNDYISAVNLESANAAAQKYFDPSKMLTVVVGKTK